jgi:hypothetical protein
MMSQRVQIYVLSAVVAILAFVVYTTYFSHSDVPGLPGVTAADTKFVPLDVQEPQLRLDLLARIQKSEYAGSHRNVFIAAPPPPPKPVGDQATARFVGPRVPPPLPPPPPVQVPGEFFGYASTPGTARRIAFFKNGDDVLLIAEGDLFLGNFRLVHIGDDSVDVQEVSSGRHATVPMTQPPAASDQQNGPAQQ